MLKKEKMVGAIVYYDGQHNDARMNIALAFTAARMGANVANHCAVTELIHETIQTTNAQGQPETKNVVRGVKCLDRYRSELMNIFSNILRFVFGVLKIKNLSFEQNVLSMQQDLIRI